MSRCDLLRARSLLRTCLWAKRSEGNRRGQGRKPARMESPGSCGAWIASQRWFHLESKWWSSVCPHHWLQDHYPTRVPQGAPSLLDTLAESDFLEKGTAVSFYQPMPQQLEDRKNLGGASTVSPKAPDPGCPVGESHCTFNDYRLMQYGCSGKIRHCLGRDPFKVHSSL